MTMSYNPYTHQSPYHNVNPPSPYVGGYQNKDIPQRPCLMNDSFQGNSSLGNNMYGGNQQLIGQGGGSRMYPQQHMQPYQQPGQHNLYNPQGPGVPYNSMQQQQQQHHVIVRTEIQETIHVAADQQQFMQQRIPTTFGGQLQGQQMPGMYQHQQQQQTGHHGNMQSAWQQQQSAGSPMPPSHHDMSAYQQQRPQGYQQNSSRFQQSHNQMQQQQSQGQQHHLKGQFMPQGNMNMHYSQMQQARFQYQQMSPTSNIQQQQQMPQQHQQMSQHRQEKPQQHQQMPQYQQMPQQHQQMPQHQPNQHQNIGMAPHQGQVQLNQQMNKSSYVAEYQQQNMIMAQQQRAMSPQQQPVSNSGEPNQIMQHNQHQQQQGSNQQQQGYVQPQVQLNQSRQQTSQQCGNQANSGANFQQMQSMSPGLQQGAQYPLNNQLHQQQYNMQQVQFSAQQMQIMQTQVVNQSQTDMMQESTTHELLLNQQQQQQHQQQQQKEEKGGNHKRISKSLEDQIKERVRLREERLAKKQAENEKSAVATIQDTANTTSTSAPQTIDQAVTIGKDEILTRVKQCETRMEKKASSNDVVAKQPKINTNSKPVIDKQESNELLEKLKQRKSRLLNDKSVPSDIKVDNNDNKNEVCTNDNSDISPINIKNVTKSFSENVEKASNETKDVTHDLVQTEGNVHTPSLGVPTGKGVEPIQDKTSNPLTKDRSTDAQNMDTTTNPVALDKKAIDSVQGSEKGELSKVTDEENGENQVNEERTNRERKDGENVSQEGQSSQNGGSASLSLNRPKTSEHEMKKPDKQKPSPKSEVTRKEDEEIDVSDIKSIRAMWQAKMKH